jgi:hypothetical protein
LKIPLNKYDPEACINKIILSEVLEKEPKLEKMIYETRNVNVKNIAYVCYACDGYNYNCENYKTLEANKI